MEMLGRRALHERWLRLTTGLVLFAYATSHLLAHATGMVSLDVLDRVGRGIILAPWRTTIGLWLLIGSLAIHGSLGIVALARRRHLRIPPGEAMQLGLGLLIPVLLLPHVVNVRLGWSLFQLDDSYYRILYQYWITSPQAGLARQIALMVVLWLHGLIGLQAWLRFRPWFHRWSRVLLGIAIAIPVAAVLGLGNAGWNATLRAVVEPGFSAQHGPPPAGSVGAAELTELAGIWDRLILAYLGVVGLVLAWRALRSRLARRYRGIRVTYPSLATVSVPRGFSVLEASRLGGVPHASVCGGRARCSTCRVRVTAGLDKLPPANAIEATTLERIKAPKGTRLACQLRPTHDLAVIPVVSTAVTPGGLRLAFDEGRELTVTALFIDLRGSTQLAAGKLPYDALFILNHYVATVSRVIEANGGFVTSVAGDGLMCVFGADGNAAAGAASGLAAAGAVWETLDAVGADLSGDASAPLRFGIGLHAGVAVLGAGVASGRHFLQFLGDTGNVASRLEAMTKELECTVIASLAVFTIARRMPPAGVAPIDVAIRGRGDMKIPVVCLRSSAELGRAPVRAGGTAGALRAT